VEQALLDLQGQLAHGLTLLHDGELIQARDVFRRSVQRARALGSEQLEAEAAMGLACACRDAEVLRRAAGPSFEVAAALFARAGRTQDQVNAVSEAAEVDIRVGQWQLAVRCMQRYDNAAGNAGRPLQFQARIAELAGANP
jgi:hypothetical protein